MVAGKTVIGGMLGNVPILLFLAFNEFKRFPVEVRWVKILPEEEPEAERLLSIASSAVVSLVCGPNSNRLLLVLEFTQLVDAIRGLIISSPLDPKEAIFRNGISVPMPELELGSLCKRILERSLTSEGT